MSGLAEMKEGQKWGPRVCEDSRGDEYRVSGIDWIRWGEDEMGKWTSALEICDQRYAVPSSHRRRGMKRERGGFSLERRDSA